jgi:hypothetical protein
MCGCLGYQGSGRHQPEGAENAQKDLQRADMDAVPPNFGQFILNAWMKRTGSGRTEKDRGF